MDLQKSLQVSAPFAGLDAHMLVALLIMLVAGILGGYANYFLRDRNLEFDARDGFRYPVLGVVAALTVPLFLNMISSALLDAGRTRSADYFVFAGFCLLYVIASRRLFENAANRLFGQLDQARRDVTQLKKSAHDAAAAAAATPVTRPLAEVVEAPVLRAAEPAKEAFAYNDIEILRAIADESFVYGNLAGLCDKTGLGRDLVSQRLAVLKNCAVIETRINDKNVLHWFVSPKGRQMLAEILGGQDDKKTA